MKLIKWLIAFSLATFTIFTLRGQSVDITPSDYWSLPKQQELYVPIVSSTLVDTNTYCVYSKIEHIGDRCVNDWRGFNRMVEEPYSGVVVTNVTNKETHQSYSRDNYTYNFLGHISTSVGVKLSEMSISKFRVEYESDTRTDNWTVGGLVSFYTLRYYYVGVRPEVFGRFYFVPNTSGEGVFVQGRLGWGRFWGENKIPFGGFGFGFDVGNKIIVIGNDHDYSNSFTLTPMAGVQAYPGPDGLSPVSWVWQLRFGYQFGGGRR